MNDDFTETQTVFHDHRIFHRRPIMAPGPDVCGSGFKRETAPTTKEVTVKIGVNLKIDVTKLDKARFFKGSKGTYADLTAFIDTEETGRYGDNGIITQAQTKEERANKTKLPICGNVKVFFSDAPKGKGPVNGNESYQPPTHTQQPATGFDDDIPF